MATGYLRVLDAYESVLTLNTIRASALREIEDCMIAWCFWSIGAWEYAPGACRGDHCPKLGRGTARVAAADAADEGRRTERPQPGR